MLKLKKGKERHGAVSCINLLLQLATVDDLNGLGWFATRRAASFNLSEELHALNDLTKDHMLSVQPWGLGSAEEKLTAIGVRSSIGHGQDAWASVLKLEVLILKLVAIDGLSTSAIVVGEISALAHELGDDAMESWTLVGHSTLFTGAQRSEILGCARNHISAELKTDKIKIQCTKSMRVIHDIVEPWQQILQVIEIIRVQILSVMHVAHKPPCWTTPNGRDCKRRQE